MEHRFTDRELEILRLAADGLTNQAIADRLFVAFETVKWYLKQIYSKLQVTNRAQAIAVAQASGLLDRARPNGEPSRPRHNLPPQPTPFIGRASELAQLNGHLADPECRLLTIVGPGGMGKTRLVLAAAAAQLPRFRDGVYLAALAPLQDPSLLPTAIADAIGLIFAPGQPPKNQLLNYLHHKHLLLVLDNLEHLLPGVGLLPELLQAAPRIQILATARERLQLQSEVVFRLAGLPLADWPTPADAAESSAGQLFLQSARRVKPAFELTPDALAALSSICRLVDGVPLGILLAASWVDALTLSEIAREIEHNFEFLDGGWRDLPERHRSLRAVFDHAWSLLTEAEQAAMRCCSVFHGGLTREAAEHVGAVSLKLLISLVDKSLLSRDPSGRFDMHELLRQYAAGRLDTLPDERQRLLARYADYYANFLDTQWAPMRSAAMPAAAAGIELEIDNVRAAWDLSVSQNQFAHVALSARVLWYFLMVRARYEEGLGLFGRAVSCLRPLPAGEARDLALGEALHSLGFFYTATGRADKAKALAEESLTTLQRYRATEIMARAYITLCRAEWLLGEFQISKDHVQAGIELAQELNNPWYLGPLQFLLGMLSVDLGDYEAALRAGAEALRHLEQTEDSYYQGLCFGLVLGRAALRMKQWEAAKRYYLRSIAYFESIQDQFEIAQANRDLSEVYGRLQEYDAAKRAYQSSLRYYANAGQKGYLISNLRVVAKIAEMQGQPDTAVELLALLATHPASLPVDAQRAQVALAELRDQLYPADFSAAYERGERLDLDAVVADLLLDS